MGLFLALEGGDGSGKGTQAKLTVEHARNELGLNVLELDFPQYGKPSAREVEKYLNGDYGGINDVHPDLASLPYSLDRFANASELRDFLQDPHGLAVANRYSASNFAHQAAKLKTPEERAAFYERQMWIEHVLLGIPRPDLNILLLVSSDIAQANVDSKDPSTRSYTTASRDIHEADPTHLDKATANYRELAELYPQWFTPVQTMTNLAIMRSREEIQLDIRTLLYQKLEELSIRT